MKRLMGLALGCLLGSPYAFGAEHSACNNPFWDYRQLTSNEVREIARSCDSAEISNLYFTRAYHMELLQEYRKLSALESYRKSDDSMYIETQRILMGMSEAFAYNAWKAGNLQVIAELIEQYDLAIERTEYLLRGNEVLANNLTGDP